MDKRDFPLGVVLSLTTGKLVCSFGDMHEFAEFVAGHPVWTHEFADEKTNLRLRNAVFRQHPELTDVDASMVTRENWQSWLEVTQRCFPKTLTFEKGTAERDEHPMESAKRLMERE